MKIIPSCSCSLFCSEPNRYPRIGICRSPGSPELPCVCCRERNPDITMDWPSCRFTRVLSRAMLRPGRSPPLLIRSEMSAFTRMSMRELCGSKRGVTVSVVPNSMLASVADPLPDTSLKLTSPPLRYDASLPLAVITVA